MTSRTRLERVDLKENKNELLKLLLHEILETGLNSSDVDGRSAHFVVRVPENCELILPGNLENVCARGIGDTTKQKILIGVDSVLLQFLVAAVVFSFLFGGQLVAWRMSAFVERALMTCEKREVATSTMDKICAPSALVNGLCRIVGLIGDILRGS